MKVLLVVIDAASPRVVCPAVHTGQLPNLRRIADAGEMHQESVTIFPSITPAATTSIVTGCYPAEHGICGAAWFDEAKQEVAYYGDDFWVIARKGFGAFLTDFLVRLNGDRLTAPTLFEVVESQGRRAASINYLVYRGPVEHKVNVPWLLAMMPGVPLAETVMGPTMLCLGGFATCHELRGAIRGKRGMMHRFGMDDEASAAMLVELAGANLLPEFTVAYFADNDYRSHEVGPHAALPTVERVDRALGDMFEAAGGFERFIQETCVIVTSDHGHSEILDARDRAAIALHDLLGDFRQATIGQPWSDTDDIMLCPNMRAAQIYLHRPSVEMTERIAGTCLLDERIDLAIWKREEPGQEPRYVVSGPRGRLQFWRADAGKGATDAFGGRWHCSGDLDVLQLTRDGNALESTEYPNALERIVGALDARQSGDIWVTARPGCEFSETRGEPHLGGGSHGALHALDSLSPLIVAGLPRRLPQAMRSVDIASLCLESLGLPARYGVGESRAAAPGTRSVSRTEHHGH